MDDFQKNGYLKFTLQLKFQTMTTTQAEILSFARLDDRKKLSKGHATSTGVL